MAQPTEIDRVIEEWTRSISIDPDNSVAYRNRGLQYAIKKDYERAIRDFDKTLSLAPEDARAYGFRAVAWQEQGNHARASADFDKAIELDPKNAAVYSSYRGRPQAGDGPDSDRTLRSTTVVSDGGAFNLLQNPFVLLGIAPNATAQDIKQAYEDAVEDRVASNDELQRAQQILLTPRLRVDAEIGGLLDVSPATTAQIISQLKRGATYDELSKALPLLHSPPRANVLAHVGATSPLGFEALEQLFETQTTVAVGAVCDAVNEFRAEAGTARIDRDAIAEALQRLQEHQTRAVIDKFIQAPDFAIRFTKFVNRILAKAASVQITKLDVFIHAYSRGVSAELSRRREKVIAACDALRAAPQDREAIAQVGPSLHRWDEIARPMQLFEAAMNREEPQARDLYFQVRNLCLWLANEKNEYETARTITRTCADVFDKLPRSIDQMKEEGELLEKLGNEKTAVELLTPLVRVGFESHEARAIRRTRSMMEAA